MRPLLLALLAFLSWWLWRRWRIHCPPGRVDALFATISLFDDPVDYVSPCSWEAKRHPHIRLLSLPDRDSMNPALRL